MFVVGSNGAHAFAAESRAVMHDFDDARVFLDDRPAIVAPMTLRLQFREAGWKARRHGLGDEGAPLHLRHGADRRGLPEVEA